MRFPQSARSKTTHAQTAWRRLVALGLGLFIASQAGLPGSRVSSAAPIGLARSASVSTETRQGRLAVFDDVWSTINERYYDPKFHGLDWDSQRETFRGLAADAGSSRELYTILRRMIAALDDSHTRVYPPEEKFDWWRPRFVSTGIAVSEVEGLPVVSAVERGSAPHRAGMRAGDIIESVDGRPSLSVINSKITAPAGPKVEARLLPVMSRFRAFATLLGGAPESVVEIRWRNKHGKERTGHFRRQWRERELDLRVRRTSNYAVIEIDAFTKPIAVAFARALREKMRGVRGLILDLRNNGGGDTDAMTDIASAVVGDGSSLGQFTERSKLSFTIFTRSKSLLSADRIAPTRLPLIVLTSERTASAAEIFVAALKASGRATLMGKETCGCVLAIRSRHLLPDGGLLDVSELDYKTAAGLRLEGNALKPDETVLVQRNDLYSGRDRAVDLAIGRLKKIEGR